MGTFQTYVNASLLPSGVQVSTIMAAAYESRATQIARLFVPIASFAGDTAQTLTDGSFNSFTDGGAQSVNRAIAPEAAANNDNNAVANRPLLPSSSAVLAGPSNILRANNDIDADNSGANNDDPGDTDDGTAGVDSAGGFNEVTAKPLIVRVRRDPLTGEITGYGVFNADGSVPGQEIIPGQPLYTPGQDGDPFESEAPDGTPFAGLPPRYKVNRMTGEIYLNNITGITGVNLDGSDGPEILTAQGGTNNIVGIAEFKALEGAALSTAQQKASELSNVIQSLATLLRGFRDRERRVLDVIR